MSVYLQVLGSAAASAVGSIKVGSFDSYSLPFSGALVWNPPPQSAVN